MDIWASTSSTTDWSAVCRGLGWNPGAVMNSAFMVVRADRVGRKHGLDALFHLREDDGSASGVRVGRLFSGDRAEIIAAGAEVSRMDHSSADRFKTAILFIAVIGLVAGLALYVAGQGDIATLVWFAGVVPALAALVIEILRSIGRGEVGLDIVAALSMTAALVFGETLAAAVVAVMYSGGTFLESFAEGRARREMHDLLSRVPRTATRHRNGGLEEVPLDEITPGDRLLIRQGDVVPVDGTVLSASAFVDTSALTGEALPVRLANGVEAVSGSTNAGEAFDLAATRRAAESTYAGIVRLVEEAQRSKAPMSRLADRWSLGFLAVTVAIATTAWWFTGDPIRAVAVLVVATPCPLILAVPVALVAGLSRAARFGVLIKGAGPLETMARIHTLILDKTGTLTDGRPQIVSIDSYRGIGEDDILRLRRGTRPGVEAPGRAGHRRGRQGARPCAAGAVGRRRDPWRRGRGPRGGTRGDCGRRRLRHHSGGPASGAHPLLAAGSVIVAVAVDGRLAGHLVMSDPLRDGSAAMLAGLRRGASSASCWPPGTGSTWPSA
jgi:cation transport ATPase